MNAPAPDSPHWFKSSHSAGEQDCLEVALGRGLVYVRDSKRKAGPVLGLSSVGFAGLVALASAQVN
ncbi:DUF397 domain-containing protein [Streptomyces globosus]|uniref:DUF397 domain-containing protein n=1 Tax=Streptomyces globosus TaxID=68209 RepID=UPI0038037E28